MATLPKALQAEKADLEKLEKQLEELQHQAPADDLMEMVRHREQVERAAAIVAERHDALQAKIALHQAAQEQEQREKQRLDNLAKVRQAADHMNAAADRYRCAIDAFLEAAEAGRVIVPLAAKIPPVVKARERGLSGEFRLIGIPQEPIPGGMTRTAGDWAIDQ